MTSLFRDDVLQEMVDDLVVKGSDDWVMLDDVDDTVMHTAERHRKRLGVDDRISVGLDIIRRALARELMIAGEVRNPGGFIPWGVDEQAALERIECGWREAGEKLQMGDVVWFANTAAGNAYAATVLDVVNTRDGWPSPKPN